MSYTAQTRKMLIAQAHDLNPVVIIGQKGLTQAVLTEIDRALFDHQLIKIRINADNKAERQMIAKTIEETLHSSCLKIIGHVAIMYRPVEAAT